VDWNNDGRKDLIVGESYGGAPVRIYLNTGTDAAPTFGSYSKLKVGGTDFSASQQAMPEIVDWNNDGKKDMLCGEVNGRVYLLINTGTDAAPSFSSKPFIQNGGGTLDVGSRSAPVAVDWNQDGKKDLILGDSSGRVRFFENKGTDAAPSFNGSVFLRGGGSTIDIGSYSRPEVADWNNDGALDLLCGSRDYDAGDPPGGVWFFAGNFMSYSYDGDGDGLPDGWERETFGDTDTSSGAPGQDTDGDGMTDRDEYVAGCGANNGGSVLAASYEGMERTGRWMSDILTWPSVEGRVYTIQQSQGLAGGWTTVKTGIAATPPANRDGVAVGQGLDLGFYRVIATWPEMP